MIVFGVMSVYLIGTSSTTLRNRLKSEAEVFSVLATPPIGDSFSIYGESGTSKVRDSMRDYLQENQTVTNATIVNLQGEPQFSYIEDKQLAISPEEASSFTPVYTTEGNNLVRVTMPYFGASGAHSYSVVYTISNEAINKAINNEIRSLAIFTILSLSITSVVTFAAISHFILRPVRKVSEQAAIISSGNLEQQIKVDGNNEIAQLGKAVNTMAESLKANITKLQEIDKVKSEFMAITSHNLRTPLTIIRSYLESIDMLTDTDALKKAIKRIGDSISRLDGFAEDVLTISQYELGKKETKEDIDVKELVDRIAEESQPMAEIHNLEFSYEVATSAKIRASKPHIKSAILNIVDNAVKFTKEGGKVAIKVLDDKNYVKIAVTDTGIGISAEEIPKLFTKFHRATSTITYDYEGTGIGLYAAKIIIENAGGNITVQSAEGKGSVFTVALPVASSDNSVDTINKELSSDV
jgi:signal transduction histidine kinase